VVASSSCRAAAQPAQPDGLSELRQLLELAAVRGLADRGLSHQECVLVMGLADATVLAARRGDALGYLRADMLFHRCLLGLAGDATMTEIARLVIAPDRSPVRPAEGSERLMAQEAREHRQLAGLISDGRVSAADHLLRIHLARRSAARLASVHAGEPEPINSGA
jgi:DNA-binding GntR family transcriptional regulator